MPRRFFLRRALAVGVLGVIGAGSYEAVEGLSTRGGKTIIRGVSPRARHLGSTSNAGGREATLATLDSGVVVPVAPWVIAENARPGTQDWVVTGHQTPGALEGFASSVSALPGQDVLLFVSTTAASFHVEAYRMGYYGGLGGRLIWQSDEVAGRQQPPPTVAPGLNTVSCPWSPSLSVRIGPEWVPGAYLLKLVGNDGQQQYIPFCLRDDTSTAAYVVQHSVTTWQAYNLWGGYSLYYGKHGTGQNFENRARVVSFDRPYPQTWAQGAADFLGNEFPVIYQMERLGLDVTYATDIDLHQRPELLLRHRSLLSLGHDEYWSAPMRDGALSALNAGVNLAFLGANACFRQIRLEPSPVGENRLQVCYKSTDDPLYGVDNSLVTVDWGAPPVSLPESTLIGSMYQSVGANDDLVITDASSWLWQGTGVVDGQVLPKVILGEFDRFDANFPGPDNVEIAAHSPVRNGKERSWSDITWYTVNQGGGVFATGNASWIGKLSDTTDFPTNVVPAPTPGVTDVLLRAMENVYGTLGRGPASLSRPSQRNWDTVYAEGNGPPPVSTVSS
jgi:hypothetical protein